MVGTVLALAASSSPEPVGAWSSLPGFRLDPDRRREAEPELSCPSSDPERCADGRDAGVVELTLTLSSPVACGVGSVRVVKLARAHKVDHPRARQTLAREVAALDGLLHPVLPRLYTAALAAPVSYVVLE